MFVAPPGEGDHHAVGAGAPPPRLRARGSAPKRDRRHYNAAHKT